MKTKSSTLPPKVLRQQHKGRQPGAEKRKGGTPPEDVLHNPLLDVPITDSMEYDMMVEQKAILKSLLTEDEIAQRRLMRETDRKIAARADLLNDTEYWVCVVFESYAQKNEFLRASGWTEFGDKYINGLHVARKMGIRLHLESFPNDKGNRRRVFAELASEDVNLPRSARQKKDRLSE